MADSTTNLDLINESQAKKEVTANALFDAASPAMLFGRRGSTTSALTWGYYGGVYVLDDGSYFDVANGTLTLTASDVNYIEVDPATGTVSANVVGFTAGYGKLYEVTTGASSVTSYVDKRAPFAGRVGPQGEQGIGAAARIYYFQEVASDVSTYHKLLQAPIPISESDDTVAVTSGGGEQLIDSYVTDPNDPGVLSIAAGVWVFNFWGYVDSLAGGNSQIRFKVYQRLEAESPVSETLLFTVDSENLTTTAAVYALRYTDTVSHAADELDRIVVKVYGVTQAVASKTVHFIHDGTLRNSYIQTPITGGQVAYPYDVGSTFNGTFPASTVLLRLPFPREVTFPAGLSGSQGVLATAATAQTDFDIKKNGVSVGTMRFAISGTVATFIMASQTVFAVGDVLTVVSPASPDATAAGIGFVLDGVRT